jgi:hypothetical protein
VQRLGFRRATEGAERHREIAERIGNVRIIGIERLFLDRQRPLVQCFGLVRTAKIGQHGARLLSEVAMDRSLVPA